MMHHEDTIWIHSYLDL